MAITKRVSGDASGGQSPRVSGVPAGGDSERVTGPVYGRESFLLTTGDVGVMPLSLSGDMGVMESHLLLSGDQYEANPDLTVRVVPNG